MATLSHAESRRLYKYSWWWNSHNSPKNSKWLQENLTDMDVKVKTMIKLIEEDADSFARRAEMYYKKRPELMKLVEEFYRAYRALAERYDHATVELRQAHRTMAEAFPIQIPLLAAEDSLAGSSSMEMEPHTPEMPHPIRLLFDTPDDLQNDAVGLSSHAEAIKKKQVNAEYIDTVTRKKGLKQLNEMFTYEGADRAMIAERRVRKGLKFEEEEIKDGSEHATLDGSRDHQKPYVVDTEEIDDKTRSLQGEVSRLLIENHDLKTQVQVESERAAKAETEVKSLCQVLSKLQTEEEAAHLQCQRCRERFSDLDAEISRGPEEASKLKDEILMGAMQLNGAEERCLLLDRTNKLLQSEVDTLIQRAEMQQQELKCKQEELENLINFIQSLQLSHSQSEDEKTALKLKVQQGVQMLKDMELKKQGLEDEGQRIKEENRVLNTQNFSSAVLIKILQDEISSLKEMIIKLEEEAGLSISQKIALLQDLQCLKEEKDDLNKRYQNVMEQVESIGLNVSSLQSSVKDLQDENLKLKVICQKNDTEEAALLEKLEDMEKLSEKNMLLERSLSDANSGLRGLRESLQTLEESHQFLQDENLKLLEICQKNDDEKFALLEKLENMENFSEKNMILDRSLSDMSVELQQLRATKNKVEESYQSLQDENLELKETCQKNNDEKLVLLEKLENMEKISEKNILLENSLSNTKTELQMTIASMKTMKDSCQSLQDENLKLKEIFQKSYDEKLVLLEKLESMEKVLEKNMLLENSLSDASAELQGLRANLKTLEETFNSIREENLELKETCQKSDNEKLFLSQKLESMERLSERNMLLGVSLSETTAKLQGQEAKLKTLEESFQSLQEEKSGLLTEKDVLVSQVESITQDMEMLSERNTLLETSISNMNVELEGLRAKSNDLEEWCQALQEEKSDLITEKDVLVSQVESITQNMERLSERNALLERSISNMKVELEGLSAKSNDLAERCQSLQGEKSDLITEKDVLVSQVESITQNMESVSERNACLESSLSNMKVELEGLRAKSNDLEECCQSLQDEKTGLLSERNDLLSQVDSVRLSLEDLEKKHKALEKKHSDLEKGRELTLNYVDELQVYLNQEKQEHANSVLSSKSELSNLEKQLHLLQDDAQRREKDFEEEQDKAMNAQLEIFILQRCIHDVKERNLSLSIECQKYVDASTQAKNAILELEKEFFWQQKKGKSLLEQSNKLKMVIHHVLKVLDISLDDECLDRIEDQTYLVHILERIKRLQRSILDVEDENQLLIFEKFINTTLLEQLRLDADNLKAENYTLERKFELRDGELSMLEAKNCQLLEKNEQLLLAQQAGIHREEALRNEMENLCALHLDLQEAYQMLQDENYRLVDGNASLVGNVNDLKEVNHILLEENDAVLREAMIQSNLSLIFENIIAEKAVELKAVHDDFYCLCQFNSNLEDEIREMVENIRKVETENLHLKESVEVLDEYRSRSLILADELNMVRHINDQLNHQIEIGKNLLSHKEVTLLEVGQKLEATQCENAELHKEIEEGRILEEHLESELLKKINEVELFERENAELHKEVEGHTAREEYLESELLKKINEVELLEIEVVTLYEGLQVSVIRASLFEEKALELIEACNNLEEISMIEKRRLDNEMDLIKSDVEELKREVCVLEGQNLGLKADMAACLPLILSFEKNVLSLESHAISSTEVLVTGNQKVQDASAAMAHQNEISSQESSEDHSIRVAAGVSGLHKLHAKVQAVEKVVMEKIGLAMLESSNAKVKLEVALEEIKELKLKARSVPEDTERRKDVILLLQGRESHEDHEQQRNDAEASQMMHGITMKDIQLDYVSGSSSHGKRSFGMGRRKITETEDEMLELWEAAEQDVNHKPMSKLTSDASMKDAIEYYQIEAVEEHRHEHPSSELQAKELEAYNPEVSKNAMKPCREEKVRIIERLASDACKLMNLQTTMTELKKKMDKSGKSNRPVGFEYNNMKTQLSEVEEAILLLVDINRKLTKNVEDDLASDSKVEDSVGEMGNARKQRIVDRVRKSSEKIWRLELEVQRIQFILLKLEEQHKSRGTRGVVDRKKTVLLRDYLYGGRRSQSKKKVPCCACVRPAAGGDFPSD